MPRQSPEIRGVLFDVGGVLIRTPFEMIAADPRIEVTWQGPFAPETDELFGQVANGTVTEREYWAARGRELAGQLGTDTHIGAMLEVFIDVKTLGVRKPAPEPYLAAARALEGNPADCLFVDDLPSNCRGAEAVGMASHFFDVIDPSGSAERLLGRLNLS